MKKKKNEFGAALRERILIEINTQCKAPKATKNIFEQLKKQIPHLTESTLKNHLNGLTAEGFLIKTESREYHPKRKPIFLYQIKPSKQMKRQFLKILFNKFSNAGLTPVEIRFLINRIEGTITTKLTDLDGSIKKKTELLEDSDFAELIEGKSKLEFKFDSIDIIDCSITDKYLITTVIYYTINGEKLHKKTTEQL